MQKMLPNRELNVTPLQLSVAAELRSLMDLSRHRGCAPTFGTTANEQPASH
jgi:hypothetical protein